MGGQSTGWTSSYFSPGFIPFALLQASYEVVRYRSRRLEKRSHTARPPIRRLPVPIPIPVPIPLPPLPPPDYKLNIVDTLGSSVPLYATISVPDSGAVYEKAQMAPCFPLFVAGAAALICLASAVSRWRKASGAQDTPENSGSGSRRSSRLRSSTPPPRESLRVRYPRSPHPHHAQRRRGGGDDEDEEEGGEETFINNDPPSDDDQEIVADEDFGDWDDGLTAGRGEPPPPPPPPPSCDTAEGPDHAPVPHLSMFWFTLFLLCSVTFVLVIIAQVVPEMSIHIRNALRNITSFDLDAEKIQVFIKNSALIIAHEWNVAQGLEDIQVVRAVMMDNTNVALVLGLTLVAGLVVTAIAVTRGRKRTTKVSPGTNAAWSAASAAITRSETDRDTVRRPRISPRTERTLRDETTLAPPTPRKVYAEAGTHVFPESSSVQNSSRSEILVAASSSKSACTQTQTRTKSEEVQTFTASIAVSTQTEAKVDSHGTQTSSDTRSYAIQTCTPTVGVSTQTMNTAVSVATQTRFLGLTRSKTTQTSSMAPGYSSHSTQTDAHVKKVYANVSTQSVAQPLPRAISSATQTSSTHRTSAAGIQTDSELPQTGFGTQTDAYENDFTTPLPTVLPSELLHLTNSPVCEISTIEGLKASWQAGYLEGFKAGAKSKSKDVQLEVGNESEWRPMFESSLPHTGDQLPTIEDLDLAFVESSVDQDYCPASPKKDSPRPLVSTLPGLTTLEEIDLDFDMLWQADDAKKPEFDEVSGPETAKLEPGNTSVWKQTLELKSSVLGARNLPGVKELDPQVGRTLVSPEVISADESGEGSGDSMRAEASVNIPASPEMRPKRQVNLKSGSCKASKGDSGTSPNDVHVSSRSQPGAHHPSSSKSQRLRKSNYRSSLENATPTLRLPSKDRAMPLSENPQLHDQTLTDDEKRISELKKKYDTRRKEANMRLEQERLWDEERGRLTAENASLGRELKSLRADVVRRSIQEEDERRAQALEAAHESMMNEEWAELEAKLFIQAEKGMALRRNIDAIQEEKAESVRITLVELASVREQLKEEQQKTALLLKEEEKHAEERATLERKLQEERDQGTQNIEGLLAENILLHQKLVDSLKRHMEEAVGRDKGMAGIEEELLGACVQVMKEEQRRTQAERELQDGIIMSRKEKEKHAQEWVEQERRIQKAIDERIYQETCLVQQKEENQLLGQKIKELEEEGARRVLNVENELASMRMRVQEEGRVWAEEEKEAQNVTARLREAIEKLAQQTADQEEGFQAELAERRQQEANLLRQLEESRLSGRDIGQRQEKATQRLQEVESELALSQAQVLAEKALRVQSEKEALDLTERQLLEQHNQQVADHLAQVEETRSLRQEIKELRAEGDRRLVMVDKLAVVQAQLSEAERLRNQEKELQKREVEMGLMLAQGQILEEQRLRVQLEQESQDLASRWQEDVQRHARELAELERRFSEGHEERVHQCARLLEQAEENRLLCRKMEELREERDRRLLEAQDRIVLMETRLQEEEELHAQEEEEAFARFKALCKEETKNAEHFAQQEQDSQAERCRLEELVSLHKEEAIQLTNHIESLTEEAVQWERELSRVREQLCELEERLLEEEEDQVIRSQICEEAAQRVREVEKELAYVRAQLREEERMRAQAEEARETEAQRTLEIENNLASTHTQLQEEQQQRFLEEKEAFARTVILQEAATKKSEELALQRQQLQQGQDEQDRLEELIASREEEVRQQERDLCLLRTRLGEEEVRKLEEEDDRARVSRLLEAEGQRVKDIEAELWEERQRRTQEEKDASARITSFAKKMEEQKRQLQEAREELEVLVSLHKEEARCFMVDIERLTGEVANKEQELCLMREQLCEEAQRRLQGEEDRERMSQLREEEAQRMLEVEATLVSTQVQLQEQEQLGKAETQRMLEVELELAAIQVQLREDQQHFEEEASARITALDNEEIRQIGEHALHEQRLQEVRQERDLLEALVTLREEEAGRLMDRIEGLTKDVARKEYDLSLAHEWLREEEERRLRGEDDQAQVSHLREEKILQVQNDLSLARTRLLVEGILTTQEREAREGAVRRVMEMGVQLQDTRDERDWLETMVSRREEEAGRLTDRVECLMEEMVQREHELSRFRDGEEQARLREEEAEEAARHLLAKAVEDQESPAEESGVPDAPSQESELPLEVEGHTQSPEPTDYTPPEPARQDPPAPSPQPSTPKSKAKYPGRILSPSRRLAISQLFGSPAKLKNRALPASKPTLIPPSPSPQKLRQKRPLALVSEAASDFASMLKGVRSGLKPVAHAHDPARRSVASTTSGLGNTIQNARDPEMQIAQLKSRTKKFGAASKAGESSNVSQDSPLAGSSS